LGRRVSRRAASRGTRGDMRGLAAEAIRPSARRLRRAELSGPHDSQPENRLRSRALMTLRRSVTRDSSLRRNTGERTWQ
jgi:hypothetical protein